MLPRELETALLKWLWTRADGIGYSEIPLPRAPSHKKSGEFERWLVSHEMLARPFPAWIDFGRPAIEWLWAQRNAQGFWDFGALSSASAYLSLSDIWREKRNRVFDWTTRVLILLRRSSDLGLMSVVANS